MAMVLMAVRVWQMRPQQVRVMGVVMAVESMAMAVRASNPQGCGRSALRSW